MRYQDRPWHEVRSGAQYEPLLRKRRIKTARLYTTPELNGALDLDFSVVTEINIIWTVGTKLWKLADKHYGDHSYYWVIGLYNDKPTDAHWKIGDEVSIPFPLKLVAETLGY